MVVAAHLMLVQMELQGHHSVGFSLDIVSCLPPGMEFLMDDELLMDLIQCMVGVACDLAAAA
jgi:hypothetical protein